ncbi:hypothetical protein GMAR_ORF220 [Golden Marseillevirus]|uniref:hypothetical protein n=1 Tax=Golden Marseillevirus TaxID=1720526 RepID=UPI000877AC2F|nr:hypothetical protein GMAR_ORF220 [Golden Marseillevirus]ALX27594.1 hypothetical protein GMAR_ORF220 [Golden Marseillevirus]
MEKLQRIDRMICPICQEEFGYLGFDKHLEEHKKNGIEDALFQCRPCEFRCNDIHTMMNHCKDVYHGARCAYAQVKVLCGDIELCKSVVQAHFRSFGNGHDGSLAVVAEMRNMFPETEPKRTGRKIIYHVVVGDE